MSFKWEKENLEEMERCGITKPIRSVAIKYFTASLQEQREKLQLGEKLDTALIFKAVLERAIALLNEDLNKAVARMDIKFIQMHAMVVHAMHHLAGDSIVQVEYDASRASFEAAVEELVNP